jgi:hypothetical protein
MLLQCKMLDCLNLPLEVFALARQFVLTGFYQKIKLETRDGSRVANKLWTLDHDRLRCDQGHPVRLLTN